MFHNSTLVFHWWGCINRCIGICGGAENQLVCWRGWIYSWQREGLILTKIMAKASRTTTKTRKSTRSTTGEESDNDNDDNYDGQNDDDIKDKDSDLNF